MAEKRKAFGREVLAERHRLIERAAALDHNNNDKLVGLAARWIDHRLSIAVLSPASIN